MAHAAYDPPAPRGTEPGPSTAGLASSPALLVLKISITLVFCVILVAGADWQETGRALARVNRPGLLVVLGVMAAGIVISAFKWGLTLTAQGARLRQLDLQRFYLVAMFLNNFLPTSVGGDGYRVYRVWRATGRKSAALVSVGVERLTGLWALLLLAWLCAILDAMWSGSALSRSIAVWGAPAAGLLVLAPLLPLLILRRRRGQEARERSGLLPAIAEGLRTYRHRPGLLASILGISFVFHLVSAAGVLALLWCVGAPCTLAQAMIIMAAAQLAGLLPISLNGLGVLDGAFVSVAALYDVPFSSGLAAVAILRLFLVLISLCGGLVHARDSLRRSVAPA